MRFIKSILTFSAVALALTLSAGNATAESTDLEKMVDGADFIATATIDKVCTAETRCEVIYSASYSVDDIMEGYQPKKEGYRVLDSLFAKKSDECPTTAAALDKEYIVNPFKKGQKVIIIENDDYGTRWLNMSQMDDVEKARKNANADGS